MNILVRCLVVVTMILVVGAANADHLEKITDIRAIAVTGTNRLFGRPTTDYGPPLGTIGFSNVAIYNPGGRQPLSVSLNSSGEAVLATMVDPDFLAAAGLPSSLIDESLINIPLREVAVNVSPSGDDRIPLPSTLTVDPLAPNQAEPVTPIRLRDWLAAKGKARLVCDTPSSSIALHLRSLIPNSLYTIWGIFESAQGGFVAVPLGGVPNVVATDNAGKAGFYRKLGFCPFKKTVEGSRLLAVDIVYHSDQQVYGFVPDLTLKGFITGTTTHTQLEFIVYGQPLLGDNYD